MKIEFNNPKHKRILELFGENRKMQDKIDKNNELIKFLKEDDEAFSTPA